MDATREPIRPVPRDGPLPLSFAQQRLWFLDRFDRKPALYNMPLRARLRGPLQAQPLAGALARSSGATRRCAPSSPRSTASRSRSSSAVLPSLSSLPLIDLAALPEPARTREEARIDGKRPGGRSTSRAGRCCARALLRLGRRASTCCCFDLHHIVSRRLVDGRAAARAGGALRGLRRRAGRRRCRSCRSSTPTSPSGSGGWLAGRGAGAAARLLAASGSPARPPLLELPTDRPRPAGADASAARTAPAAPAGRARAPACDGLGRREGATLFMTLLAALRRRCSRRYTGQDDLAGRHADRQPQPRARSRG